METITRHHYPTFEMADHPIPLPAPAKEKDLLPRAPVRKVTPTRASRTMVRVNRLSTSEDSPIAMKAPTATPPNDVNEFKTPLSFDYGYGKAVPNSETAPLKGGYDDDDVYGYASASPDVNKKQRSNAADLYGYESGSLDVARNSKLVSDSTDHYRTASATNYQYDGTRIPRRSSLKSCSSYGGQPLGRRSCHAVVGDRRRPPERRNSSIEVRVRGERNLVQRRRSVDFANKVHVKEVEPVKDLTNNIRDLWLQADDFAQMKQHRRSLLEQYKQKQRSDSVNMLSSTSGEVMAPGLASIHHTDEQNIDDSFRGLERYIDRSGRRQKNMAWDTVLLEQDEQECSGYFDENRIAELYKYTTQESPEKAFARAQQDREAVQEYLTSPKTTKLMASSRFKALRRVSC